jgi:hypothetical protein
MGNGTAGNGRKGSAPKVRIAQVTPKKAAELLRRNSENRSQRDSKVAAYAAEMDAGRWDLSWDAIAIDDEGTLRNGQHRLAAVLRSGRTVPFLIVEGVPAVASDVGDRGIYRTIADIFYLHEVPNAKSIAAMARSIWILETRGILAGGMGAQTRQFTYREAADVLDRHPGMQDHTHALQVPALTPSQSCTLSYVLNYIDNDDARAFLAVLTTGTDDESAPATGDPRLVVRDRLLRSIASKNRRDDLSLKEAMQIIILAWNAWRAGETPTRFNWRAGGSSPSKVPLIDGWPYTDEALSVLGVLQAPA